MLQKESGLSGVLNVKGSYRLINVNTWSLGRKAVSMFSRIRKYGTVGESVSSVFISLCLPTFLSVSLMSLSSLCLSIFLSLFLSVCEPGSSCQVMLKCHVRCQAPCRDVNGLNF